MYKEQHSTCHAAGVPCPSPCHWHVPGSPAYLTPPTPGRTLPHTPGRTLPHPRENTSPIPGGIPPHTPGRTLPPHSCFCPSITSSWPLVEIRFRLLTVSGGDYGGKEAKTQTRMIQESLFMLRLLGYHTQSHKKGQTGEGQ